MARWFSDEEIVGLDPKLIELLDAARGYARVPFIIVSGYRSPEHNASIGGVPNSAHTKGKAVDLACTDSHVRMRMVTGLLLAGFRRIEIADKHCHADIDDSLPQDVLIWGKSK